MSTVQENPTILPVQAGLFSEDKQVYFDTGVKWIKTGLNVADYVPSESVKGFATDFRVAIALCYLAFVSLKYAYLGLYLDEKQAKATFDKELVVGTSHALRGGMTIFGWIGILKLGYDENQTAFIHSIIFMTYDAYANADKENKWFNFYA